jgi:glucosylglycerate synthase
LIESLRAHKSYWLKADGVAKLRTWGTDPVAATEPVSWDYQSLAEQAKHDIEEITPLLEDALEPGLFLGLIENTADGARLDDELWVRTVYEFATAIERGRAAIDHLADMFAPLYMWRAAAFMAQTAQESPAVVQARLDALCDTFQRLKPVLVANWSDEKRSR